MDKAKIRLSQKESELVANADWILTKNGILQKAKYILEYLQGQQQQFFSSHPAAVPAEVMAISPKISKGENYKGLPYLVLDFPRFFDREDHFAVRCMFWWGNFFSITLHLSGIYKTKYENKMEASFMFLKEEGFFISVGEDQWEHHFETTNYRQLNKMNQDEFRKHLAGRNFIKLAKRFPLEQWEDAGDILLASFCKMINWLGS
ncbi:MAG: hypothetical protein Q8941_17865 [Bacteroidota bacterium]|nr:hypothetical protein [Bacteroidota bacterium]